MAACAAPDYRRQLSMDRPGSGHLALRSVNHISKVCSNVAASVAFYRDVLGFHVVKRPDAFNESFEGCWLWRYGLGLHLIKGQPVPRSTHIDPKADHLSFQADSLEAVTAQLGRRGIPYVQQRVMEDGMEVSQLFFHDPDNNMIEVCNCDCLPIIPLDLPRCNTCANEAAAMLPGASPHKPAMLVPQCQACCAAAGPCCSCEDDEAMIESRDSLDSSRSETTPRFSTSAAALAAAPLP